MDIVEALRTDNRMLGDPLARKAADEIERLRASLGAMVSAAAEIIQSNDAGNEPDIVPLLNAFRRATDLLKSEI